MQKEVVLNFVKEVLENMPKDWLKLTTHRLDLYDESLAKTQFLEKFEELFETKNSQTEALNQLPTAFDYIRLGHPLSCVLEWTIAKLEGLNTDEVICFSSQTMPILAVLRTNLLDNKTTTIYYKNELPNCFDAEALRSVYGYQFELNQIDSADDISADKESTVFISATETFQETKDHPAIHFSVNILAELGSIISVQGEDRDKYVSAIQHVRRRESISMTPADCHTALKKLIGAAEEERKNTTFEKNQTAVRDCIKEITATKSDALLGSSGLSTQYAIMMGLIDHALEAHPNKEIKFLVPPNCYGGTNDQARRVAASHEKVEILDLPVDGDNNMVQSIHRVLEAVAEVDAVPFIIAEIPTNPRVEVPNLEKLKNALSAHRTTSEGHAAIDPVFILDQTFCPNFNFLGENQVLSSVRAISYVSGSKFPSGGKCTAGYCVANEKAKGLLGKVKKHLDLCDNAATALQTEILAQQLPSMTRRIKEAYENTREFVNFIETTLPEAKINFVSEELAEQGFTPSVFSLDLPTKGDTPAKQEVYKRALNHKLIRLMISRIPEESKYCVSYGQLKGCYWTIPATSTQGTTKESDKDYIARVSMAPELDLEKHKEVFADFVEGI